MASTEIDSGICGFHTTVRSTNEGDSVRLEFASGCPHVAELAEHLTEVDPWREISFRGEGPLTLRLAAEHLAHPACPVPCGIIKAIEVAAQLALPKEVSIKPSRD